VQINSKLTNLTLQLNSVFFTDANTGYAIGKYESQEDGRTKGILLKTFDGGANWDTLWIDKTTENNSSLTSVFFTDANTGFFVGYSEFFNGGIILKTNDGGFTLDTLSFEFVNFELVYFINANIGFAASTGDILKTIDGGNTWTIIDNESRSSLVSFADENTWYAVYGGTFKKTCNGGATWTTLSCGTGNNLNSAYFIDANTGYAVGDKETIIKTTDGGSNWKALWSATFGGEICFNLSSVFFTDSNTGYVTGWYKYGWCERGCYGGEIILKTIDGGVTWENTLSNGPYSLLNSIFFTDANTGYAVGNNGTILKTTNGGGFPTAVKNVSLESSFTVYPNPATNKISIENHNNLQGETTICIFNMNGALLQQEKFQSQTLIEMDVSAMAKGIYLLKIQTKAGFETKKLVVQ